MALPSDIKLPAGARYYQFVEKDLKFNSNYDIVWSFQFRVPGDLGHTGATPLHKIMNMRLVPF